MRTDTIRVRLPLRHIESASGSASLADWGTDRGLCAGDAI